MSKNKLLGVWKLIEYSILLDKDKTTVHPYGDNPQGYLIYTAKGHVSVHIMQESAKKYGGYLGRYEIGEQMITHIPEICGFISYLNTPQIRQFQLVGSMLTLSYFHHNEDDGYEGGAKLIWEKMSGES